MLAGVPFGLGPFELILILAIVVIIFGVGRLPEVGGAVGKGIREFRKASKETEEPEEGPTSSEANVESSAPAEGPPRAESASRHCTNCGAEVPEQAKFCAECGTPVQAGVK